MRENVVLSKFDPETIRDFLERFESLKREEPKVKVRPSELIVSSVEEYW